jgi:hypothetical protein
MLILDVLLDSKGGKYALKALVESKARYLEPLMLAAISKHVQSGAVASLLSTLLSTLDISSVSSSMHNADYKGQIELDSSPS